MHLKQELQKAVQRFDWDTCKKHLERVDSEEPLELLDRFVRVVVRDGYIILRHCTPQKKERRSTFVKSLTAFINASSQAGLSEFFANGCEYAKHTENAYQSVLSVVEREVLADLAPSDIAWFTALKAEQSLRGMTSRVHSLLADKETVIDPVTAKFAVDDEGANGSPDAVLNTLNTTLTSTFKMLAYSNGWFDSNGILVLPHFEKPKSLPRQEIVEDVLARNYYLSNLWSQIERSDGRCRYFDGRVVLNQSETQVIEFQFEDAGEIDLHLAGERQRRMAFGFFAEHDSSPQLKAKVSGQPPVQPAPAQYVSNDEIHWTILLSHLLYQSVVEITKEFEGLTLLEWLRGYAVIQKIAKQFLSKPIAIPVVPSEALLNILVDHGMFRNKAEVFLDRVALSKKSKDTFDAPLVRCDDGTFLLLVPMAAHVNAVFTVLSQLAQRGCNLDRKGTTFENDVLTLFRQHNLKATGIDRRKGGNNIEIDCVLLWDDCLFIIECKNYSLPSDNPQSEYWFLEDQKDAERQVLRKVAAIEKYPELIHDYFGENASWSRVVPVVLNGIPFSRMKSANGVCFYDASALHRFFEDGFIGLATMQPNAPSPGVVLTEVERFYSGESPTPNDFIRQLEAPSQVVQGKKFFKTTRRLIDVAEGLQISTGIPERLPTTMESLAAT